MIKVVLPTQLDSYTNGERELNLQLQDGESSSLRLMDVIDALEQRYRGLAFRIVDEQQCIRRHIAIFVGDRMVRTLDVPLNGNERVQIVGALSGG